MLGHLDSRHCYEEDDLLREGGLHIIRLTRVRPATVRRAPLGKYCKVFRLLQQDTMSEAEWGYVERFHAQYPYDFKELHATRQQLPAEWREVVHSAEPTSLLSGLPEDLIEVAEDPEDNEPLHHLVVRNASGRGERIKPRRH